MKKIFCFVLSVIMTLSVFALSSSAALPEDNSVMPMYNNVLYFRYAFDIDSSTRVATVSVGYIAHSNTSVEAVITSYIESYSESTGKWRRIDIGTTNDQWVDESTGSNYSNTHTTTIHYPGTYRALIEYQISGTGGATDVFTKTIEATFP